MPHDTEGNEPEGRAQQVASETAGDNGKPPKSMEGPPHAIKPWEEIVQPRLTAKSYLLSRAENQFGRLFYVWRGSDGGYYSPVFTDEDKAVRYPETNLFRLFSGEELAEQVKAEGLA